MARGPSILIDRQSLATNMSQVADPMMNTAISAREVEGETYCGALSLFTSKDRFSFEKIFDGTSYVLLGYRDHPSTDSWHF